MRRFPKRGVSSSGTDFHAKDRSINYCRILRNGTIVPFWQQIIEDDFQVGSCWIPGSYIPYTGLNHLILNGFFQRCCIGHDPRVEPVKTTSYAKLDQLRPWNPI